MFQVDEVGMVSDLLEDYVHAGQGQSFIVDTEADVVVGVAYHQPKPATRVADLTMIAIDPRHQDRGRGGALMAHVEDRLRREGQRLLLVETSSTSQRP